MFKNNSGSYVILLILAVVIAGTVVSSFLLQISKKTNTPVINNNQETSSTQTLVNTSNIWLYDPIYCEQDTDCTLQFPLDCGCGCGKPVNTQSYVEPPCEENNMICDIYCPPITLSCVDNQCTAKIENGWRVVNNIDIVNQQFTFDGCGQVADYKSYDWFKEFEWNLAEAELNLSQIKEMCYSENGQMLVMIISGSHCQSGDIYRFDIGKDNMLKADIVDYDLDCLGSFNGFGKRVGNIIKVMGFIGDASCATEMYYDYNFLSNSVELISGLNYCADGGGRENGRWTYYAGSLCEDEPKISAIGRAVYPIDPKYNENLHFLGQLFTASECSDARLSSIPGVKDDQYYLGSDLYLKENPSLELLETLRKIGYYCTAKISDNTCQQWELMDIIPVSQLLKLQPYYKELLSDDCIDCG